MLPPLYRRSPYREMRARREPLINAARAAQLRCELVHAFLAFRARVRHHERAKQFNSLRQKKKGM
jgi:hypothetical protein